MGRGSGSGVSGECEVPVGDGAAGDEPDPAAHDHVRAVGDGRLATGTTEEQSDAWFVGYTPDVSTAVWTGHANDRTPVPGYGADLSAPIWHDYTEAYIAETGNCNDYPEPEEPADLSSYSSDQTIVDSTYETYDETTTPTTPTDPDTGAVEPPVDGTDADGDGFPDDAYAPGADQEPAPTP